MCNIVPAKQSEEESLELGVSFKDAFDAPSSQLFSRGKRSLLFDTTHSGYRLLGEGVTKPTMEFIKTNPHPAGKKTGDCVIRALAIAEDKKWIDVYDDLCTLGRKLHDMPNNKKVYEAYLIKRGWTKQRMPKHPTGKRYTLRQLADEKPKGTLVVSIARHIATVRDGNLLDTWNCGHKCVGNYFTK